MRWAARRSRRSRFWRGPGKGDVGEPGGDSEGRRGEDARGRLRILGGHSVADDGDQVRLRGDRHDSSRAHQGQRRRASGRRAGVHQAPRHRRHFHGAQARHRARGGCRRIDASMLTLNRAAPARQCWASRSTAARTSPASGLPATRAKWRWPAR